MINQQLIDYIKQQLGQGISEEAIVNELLTSGWQKGDVDEAFKTANDQKNSIPTPPTKLASKNSVNEEELKKLLKNCGTWGIVFGILMAVLSVIMNVFFIRFSMEDVIVNLIIAIFFVVFGIKIRKNHQNVIKAKKQIKIIFWLSIFWVVVAFVGGGGPGFIISLLYLWDVWHCLNYYKKLGM